MNASQLEAILDGPALSPPPGYSSNLINPPNYKLASYVSTSIAVSVSTLAIGIRMYTRIRITKEVNYADYSLLLGWALFVCFVAKWYLIFLYNLGLHQWDISLRDFRNYAYWYFIGAIEYGVIICCVKFSILAQYIQIFMPTRRPPALYWLTVFLMIANILTYTIITFIEIFGCSPVERAWDPLITYGHCLKGSVSLNTVVSAINCGSDFIILAIPQLVIWRLKTTWKNKVTISIVFMVALLAIASSVIRLYYSVELGRTEDRAYYTWVAGIWALPEIMCGIVVASIPGFQPFFREISDSNFFKRVSSSARRTATRIATRARTRNLHERHISNDSNELSSWPSENDRPGSDRTLIRAVHGGEATSTSMEGLRGNTTFERSTEQGQL